MASINKTDTERTPKSRNRKKAGVSNSLPGLIVTGVYALAAVWFFLRLKRMNLLPSKYMWLVVGALLVLGGLIAALCWNKRKKVPFIIGCVLAALGLAGSVVGTMASDKVHDTIRQWTPETVAGSRMINMTVFVKNDDPASSLADLKDETFGLLENMERSEADAVLKEIGKSIGKEPKTQGFTAPAEALNALLGGSVRALVMDQEHMKALESFPGFEDLAKKVRSLINYPVEKMPETTAPALTEPESSTGESTQADSKSAHESYKWVDLGTVEQTEEVEETTAAPTQAPTQGGQASNPTQGGNSGGGGGGGGGYAPAINSPDPSRIFTVYISGSDSRSGINSRAQSDVNIIAVVNMNSHHILLINTPRDYYLRFPVLGGARDKLTHAGLYGLQASMDALEGLFGVEPSYYAMTDFNGFRRMIDAMGGVTVYSNYDFWSGAIHFNQGNNHLNGVAALQFVRQRYGLPGGDVARGLHQMNLIKAVAQKAASGALVANFDAVMSAIGSSIISNMTYDMIASLSRSFINGDGWTVASYTLSGAGATEYCPSLGAANYVMWPDNGKVDYARNMIRRAYNGEKVSP